MMKKPFLVSIEIEYAAMAENETEAIEHARQVVDDSYLACHCVASPLHRLPDGWDSDSLVYGSDEDRTVGELLEQSEEYQRTLQKLKDAAKRAGLK